MTMDLQAVFVRLEHLERLVRTQKKEIDNLRRIVITERTPKAGDIHALREDLSNSSYHAQQQKHSPMYRESRNYSRRHADAHLMPPEVPTYHRQTFHPYQMNSFVHPPSAIPPGGTAPSAPGRTPPAHNGTPNHNDKWQANWREVRQSPPRAPKSVSPSRKMRWSAAPDLGATADDVISDLSDSQNSQDRRKHSRQGFVEPSTPKTTTTPPVVTTSKDSLPVTTQSKKPVDTDDDDELIDVEKLDTSGSTGRQSTENHDNGTLSKPDLTVALRDKKELSTVDIQSDSESEVQEIAIYPPKPRGSLVICKPLNRIGKVEPSVRGTNGTTMKTPNNISKGKQFTKVVPKRNKLIESSPPDPLDNSWIWRKDAAQKRTSLPEDLKKIIKKSPF